MDCVGAMKPSYPIQGSVNLNGSNEECRSSGTNHYFTGCYGLPYPDHNYGAPLPAQSPPATAPARLAKTTPRWPPVEPVSREVNTELVFDTRQADEEPEVDDSVTRCICEFAHDDGYMICCDQCSVWQHLDCMGIDRNNIPDTFFCERCQPRYIDKKRAIEMQKWKREELLKLALAQGNPTDLKKLGVNARKIMAFKQKHQYKKVKEKLTHKQFRRKSVDVLPKKKAKLKMAKMEPSRLKSVEENQNYRNSKFVEADSNEYSPELREALAKEKNHRLMDTVDTVLFIKLLAQLRNNAYLYNRVGNKGLVASEKVFTNQPIIEYRGKVMLREQCEHPAVTNKQRNTHILYYGRVNHLDVCVDSSHYGNEARYLRRSCTPNAEVRHVINGERIHFIVYSRADIEAGSEITIPFDYNYRESTSFVECACTLSDCPIVKYIEMISSAKKENALPFNNVQVSPPPAPQVTPQRRERRKSSNMSGDQPVAKKKRKNSVLTPERTATTKPVKTPPSAGDGHSDSDTAHHNGTHDDHDKRKMTREERKLEAIMKAFENMEKKQGRRKTLSRSEHPVICNNRDDDIAPEFVNDSPDRSMPSPVKNLSSPVKTSPKIEPKETKVETKVEAKVELKVEVENIDVTSVEEVSSPKTSPKVEVEEDYRHFLDAMKSDKLEKLDKLESDTGTDDGGKSPSMTLATRTASESSAGETTPCPTSESEVQSPPKRKGWRRRSTLTARRNNRVKSMNDVTPVRPPSPVAPEPAFVHKTKKAINETASADSSEAGEDSLQGRLSPEEEFVKFMPNSRNLSHLRRSSAGGVRGSESGSSSYSTKKRWLKQAMTEDPGPMLPPPAYSPDPFTGSSTSSSPAFNNEPSLADSITPLKKRRLAWQYSENDVRDSFALPVSPLVLRSASQPATPTAIHRPSPVFPSGITTAAVTPASTPSTCTAVDSTPSTSTLAAGTPAENTPVCAPHLEPQETIANESNAEESTELPRLPIVAEDSPSAINESPPVLHAELPHPAGDEPRIEFAEPAELLPQRVAVENSGVETKLAEEPMVCILQNAVDARKESDDIVKVNNREQTGSSEEVGYQPPSPSEPAPGDDVEEGEIIEEGNLEEPMEEEEKVVESAKETVTPEVVEEEVDTDKLISDIDAKLFDLERQIAGRAASPPPPPPPRPAFTAGILPPTLGLSPMMTPLMGMPVLPIGLPVHQPPVLVPEPIAPSPTVKRKVSLADYRRRRQSTSKQEISNSPPHQGSPVAREPLPNVMDASNLSLAPIPLPILPESKTGVSKHKKFSEPTLAERIAERACEHKCPSAHLERPKSLAERLKSEFGLDTVSDD